MLLIQEDTGGGKKKIIHTEGLVLHAQLLLRPMRGWRKEKCIYSGGSKCEEGEKEIAGSGRTKQEVMWDDVVLICEAFKELNNARPPHSQDDCTVAVLSWSVWTRVVEF